MAKVEMIMTWDEAVQQPAEAQILGHLGQDLRSGLGHLGNHTTKKPPYRPTCVLLKYLG